MLGLKKKHNYNESERNSSSPFTKFQAEQLLRYKGKTENLKFNFINYFKKDQYEKSNIIVFINVIKKLYYRKLLHNSRYIHFHTIAINFF